MENFEVLEAQSTKKEVDVPVKCETKSFIKNQDSLVVNNNIGFSQLLSKTCHMKYRKNKIAFHTIINIMDYVGT